MRYACAAMSDVHCENCESHGVKSEVWCVCPRFAFISYCIEYAVSYRISEEQYGNLLYQISQCARPNYSTVCTMYMHILFMHQIL